MNEPISGDMASESDPLLARLEFNSDLYPEAERSAAYQQEVAGPATLTPQSSHFHARIVGYVAGPVRFHAVDASPHLFERTALKAAMDSADYLAIQHVIEGEVEGDCDGKPIHAVAGSVYIMNFRQPMTLLEKADTQLHFVTVNRTAAIAQFGDLAKLHGRVFDANEAASYIRFLEAVYPELALTRKSGVRALVSETLSELMRLFGLEAVLAPPPTLGEQARAYIEDHLAARELTPESVAKALEVSRSRLLPTVSGGGGRRQVYLGTAAGPGACGADASQR